MVDLNKKLSLDIEHFNVLRKESCKLFKKSHALENSYKEIKFNIQKMTKIINERKNELTILENFIKVLLTIGPSTYWVFNLTDKAEHKHLISERKKLANNYRRKIKAMEDRLERVKFYLSFVPTPKSH